MTDIDPANLVATVLFVLAVLHTFSANYIHRLALKHPADSIRGRTLHILGEVELVFALWAGIYLQFLFWTKGFHASIEYMEGLNFTEPAFVFVIMAVCATKPVVAMAELVMSGIVRLVPGSKSFSLFLVLLIVGPLLGSFITEPAAMTITASLLLRHFFQKQMSPSFKYATIGALFVNVSIGGTLTPYAAPPVLMVAGKWNWDFNFMMEHFGWKAAIATTVIGLATALIFRRELIQLPKPSAEKRTVPAWIICISLAFLTVIVVTAHHMAVFMGFFLFFLGFVSIATKYHGEFHLRQGLLVALFLGGLVVLGAPQGWWLKPLLSSLDSGFLFLAATSLTAITDNAALTYLGSLVPNLPEASKYALVAGAVTGGGLTVIANAPNPAGYGILKSAFGKSGIHPFKVFLGALGPTLVALLAFWFL